VRFEHALWVGERASEGVRVTAINDLMGKHVESHVSDKTCRREEIRRETGLTKICPLTQEAIEGGVAKDQISGRSKPPCALLERRRRHTFVREQEDRHGSNVRRLLSGRS
jgi:hypothetical protein